MGSETRTQTRQLPGWLIILILVLFVLGIGGFVVMQFAGGKKKDAGGTIAAGKPDAGGATAPPVTGGRGGQGGGGGGNRGILGLNRRGGGGGGGNGGGGGGNNGPRDGIQRRGFFGGAQITRAGNALAVVGTKDDGSKTYTFRYESADFMTPEIKSALDALWHSLGLPGGQQAMKLTNDQIDKLSALPPVDLMGVTIKATPDQVKQFKDLWDAYERAGNNNGPEREKVIVDLVKAIGKDSYDATKADYLNRAKQIREILTPEQIAESDRMTAAVRAASTRPAP